MDKGDFLRIVPRARQSGVFRRRRLWMSAQDQQTTALGRHRTSPFRHSRERGNPAAALELVPAFAGMTKVRILNLRHCALPASVLRQAQNERGIGSGLGIVRGAEISDSAQLSTALFRLRNNIKKIRPRRRADP
jgi:hypothetical protein